MSEPRYSRPRFLRRAGGGLAGIGLLAAGGGAVAKATGFGLDADAPPVTLTPFSPNPPAVIAGALRTADSRSRTAILDAPGRGPTKVIFDQAALLWRDHPVDLAAFTPGEVLVAEGTWQAKTFSAFSLITIYQSLYATVTGVSGNAIDTSQGEVVLVPETRHQEGETLSPVSTSEVRQGESVGAIVRYVPRDHEYVALRVL